MQLEAAGLLLGRKAYPVLGRDCSNGVVCRSHQERFSGVVLSRRCRFGVPTALTVLDEIMDGRAEILVGVLSRH